MASRRQWIAVPRRTVYRTGFKPASSRRFRKMRKRKKMWRKRTDRKNGRPWKGKDKTERRQIKKLLLIPVGHPVTEMIKGRSKEILIRNSILSSDGDKMVHDADGVLQERCQLNCSTLHTSTMNIISRDCHKWDILLQSLTRKHHSILCLLQRTFKCVQLVALVWPRLK